MKTYKISYHTKHESCNGYTHSDGWQTYEVKAKTSREAEKKAKTLWEKDYGDSGRHWINQTIVN